MIHTMKKYGPLRWLLLALGAAALVTGSSTSRAAPPRGRPALRGAPRQVIVAPGGFIVTQFAVPVAVPVAPQAYFAYPPLPPAPPISAAEASGMQAADVESDVAGADLVRQQCGACHAAESPRGGFQLRNPAELTDAERVSAVRRLLDDDPGRRMPKGRELTSRELGQLIHALVE